MKCPHCGHDPIVKNGITSSSGKQNDLCRGCKFQFVENPEKKPVSQEKKEQIDGLLLERISLAGIARATRVSESGLPSYVNEKYPSILRRVDVESKQKGRLIIECDEMWFFCMKKKNKPWIGLALDRDTREIVGVHIGRRNEKGAQALWDRLPPVYRPCAVSDTDFWAAYACIFPSKRHRAVGKESGQTNHIERLNNPFRQRVSRLVRKTVSFSKKIENHIGAIWLFVHHDNSVIRASLA